ncbi:MAG: tail fiber protein [Caulobacter sp.]|nr:tail fiber protein [Caulobacter sp.]
MTDAFIGEIRAFPFDYAPEGWLLCDGAELSITRYQALFAVIESRFGGNGKTNFRTPDLRSVVAVGAGAGPGLTERALAAAWGTEQVTLGMKDIPAHQHTVNGRFHSTVTNLANVPYGTMMISRTNTQFDYANINIDPTKVAVGLSPKAIGSAGGGQPHENRQPVVALIYCICADGEYPE